MQRQLPQLEMILLADKFKESIDLPSNLEFVEEQNSKAWLTIINETFGFEFGEEDYQNEMNQVIHADKSQLLFIKDKDKNFVATGSIILDDKIAELHYIAVKNSFRGNNLGFKISAKLIENAIKLGATVIKLHTDVYRIAAIKTYLKLGFKPNLSHSNHSARWLKIINENNLEIEVSPMFE